MLNLRPLGDESPRYERVSNWDWLAPCVPGELKIPSHAFCPSPVSLYRSRYAPDLLITVFSLRLLWWYPHLTCRGPSAYTCECRTISWWKEQQASKSTRISPHGQSKTRNFCEGHARMKVMCALIYHEKDEQDRWQVNPRELSVSQIEIGSRLARLES